MIKEGHSIQDIGQARDIKTQSVLRHLMVLADSGERFDISSYIKPRSPGVLCARPPRTGLTATRCLRSRTPPQPAPTTTSSST